RRLLGDTTDPPLYIANVAGRGYRFVAPTIAAAQVDLPGALSAPGLTRLIGRDQEVATLKERVAKRRLITVSGPGGIGKTTVAVAVAASAQHLFEDGIFTVDLGAAAASASDLPQAIAMALRLSVVPSDPLPGLTAFLRDKNLLLLLDNCEHIIGA